MKVAFAIIPEKGHIHPYIGPAQALADAGHEVVVAAPGDISAQIARAGLVFRPDLIRLGASDRVTCGAELVDLIQDGERLHRWIEQLLLGGLPDGVQPLRDWYRREAADVIVADPLYYAAAIAAQVEGLPWASVSNSLNPVILPEFDSALLRTVEQLGERRSALFRGFGIAARFAGCDVLSPYLNIAFATQALVGKPPACVTLVGPSAPLHARGDETALAPILTSRPVIYVSFGSQICFWPDVFEKIYAAGLLLQAHLVMAIGDLVDDPRWFTPREHCHIYRYAPQRDVLKRAAVFVTHGGANSVTEAIAAGVPMLVAPMCNDQFHQAFFVERAGIGTVEDLLQAPTEQIAERLRHLLTSSIVRANMERVSKTYQANGAITAAKLIANLAGRD